MQKYTQITKGMKTVDVQKEEGGYNYYGSIRHNGEWSIMREKTDQTEYRYILGATGYTTAWTARASLNYGLPTLG